jgi:hypothetical protein
MFHCHKFVRMSRLITGSLDSDLIFYHLVAFIQVLISKKRILVYVILVYRIDLIEMSGLKVAGPVILHCLHQILIRFYSIHFRITFKPQIDIITIGES